MNELWYRNVSYTDAKDLLKENLVNTVGSFVAAGYWLKYIQSIKGYEKDGYSDIWEFAESKYGLKMSEASRAMNMNTKYSVDGNSPTMLEAFTVYNKSQLQEMLTMTEEQLELVSEEMTIKEIRQIKKTGATEEQLAMLREILKDFMQESYMDFYYSFQDREDTDSVIIEVMDSYMPVKYKGKVLFMYEDQNEVVDRSTGEVLAIYRTEIILSMIREEYHLAHEEKVIKIKPNIKGLMDDSYCGSCGASLEETDVICRYCGQAIDWSNDNVVATSQDIVNTVSEEVLEVPVLEEILEEIEMVEEVPEEPLTFEVLDEENEIIIDGEFREIPQEEPVEELSAYGLEKNVYPENSLIAIKGCGHKHDCFSCAQHCGIRQENRYCMEAPMGNPFSCNTMNVLELLKEDIGDSCQFINNELAERTGESNEPVPCCKNCQEMCGYRCNRSKKVPEEKFVLDESEDSQLAAVEKSELDITKEILAKESQLLNEYLAIEDLPQFTVERQKIIVGALANMICELEEMQEEEKPEQPELTILRNNDERKAFIDNYQSWPVWIDQAITGEKYYRYDFENGESFVVKVYFHKFFDMSIQSKKWEERYRDDYGSEEYYILRDGKYFKDCLTNKSCMVEYLKNIQKEKK